MFDKMHGMDRLCPQARFTHQDKSEVQLLNDFFRKCEAYSTGVLI